VKKFPPEENFCVWCDLPVYGLHSNLSRDVTNRLMLQCIKILQDFSSVTEVKEGHIQQLVSHRKYLD